MNNKTLGIIIKRQNFAEADRILTIFTERFGKVKAIARGVRKIAAKMAGSLEPFMLVELQLYEGRNFFTVTGAQIVRDFPTVHTDLEKMAKAFYMGELIDKFETERQRSVGAFELLAGALDALDNSNKALVVRAFEVRLLKLGGFWPDLSECLHCKRVIGPDENYWDGNEGGLICPECQKVNYHGQPVTVNLVKLLRLIEREEYSTIIRLKVALELEREIEGVLSLYIKHILESDIRSERFMRGVEH
ncbi:MAG: DNA repair protein RecO [bacterium ADurb.Bin400]|nr:MAG: DNA repair protein RecO [bacterium ADurb.Bin400]